MLDKPKRILWTKWLVLSPSDNPLPTCRPHSFPSPIFSINSCVNHQPLICINHFNPARKEKEGGRINCMLPGTLNVGLRLWMTPCSKTWTTAPICPPIRLQVLPGYKCLTLHTTTAGRVAAIGSWFLSGKRSEMAFFLDSLPWKKYLHDLRYKGTQNG